MRTNAAGRATLEPELFRVLHGPVDSLSTQPAPRPANFGVFDERVCAPNRGLANREPRRRDQFQHRFCRGTTRRPTSTEHGARQIAQGLHADGVRQTHVLTYAQKSRNRVVPCRRRWGFRTRPPRLASPAAFCIHGSRFRRCRAARYHPVRNPTFHVMILLRGSGPETGCPTPTLARTDMRVNPPSTPT